MHFTNPIFLWALTGLAIPVGIHLLSRKEGKVIRMGSLRHLEETTTQQFKGIKLNEILLLCLRCLLITLFTLLLSGLQWNSSNITKWVLVEKGLETRPELKTPIDSLLERGYESRWLVSGFPKLNDSISKNLTDNYRSIIWQLSQTNTTDIVVFSSNNVSRFMGSRTFLPPNVRWISIPMDSTAYILQAVAKDDSIVIRKGHTSESQTYFTNEQAVKTSVQQTSAIKKVSITIVSDDAHTYDSRIVKAALNAVRSSFPVDISISESGPQATASSADWVIWLADSKSTANGHSLVLQPSKTKRLIVHETKNTWLLTKRLTEEVAVDDNLTLAIANLVLPDREELKKTALHNDRRMVSDSTAWGTNRKTQSAVAGIIPTTADPYLLLLFVIVLIGERILAFRKNQ